MPGILNTFPSVQCTRIKLRPELGKIQRKSFFFLCITNMAIINLQADSNHTIVQNIYFSPRTWLSSSPFRQHTMYYFFDSENLSKIKHFGQPIEPYLMFKKLSQMYFSSVSTSVQYLWVDICRNALLHIRHSITILQTIPGMLGC